ncbi:MAG: type II secretion system protein [Deltaproteobacteria bacterium]|nr:type II secretion system protein [Deltaproteobacteria bacterium]MCB9785183.1 type II secretion system protein [Deltaproteobacteria bacterium]
MIGAGRRAFTLLEVMIAMAILAFLMAAISSTQGSSLLQGARVYNLTTATQLLDSVVLDLEEEYRLEGFPENSLEERKCELPREFRDFDCRFDLLALDVGADNIAALGEQATETVGGSPLIQTLCGGGPAGSGLPNLNDVAGTGDANLIGELGALKALLDPQFASLCGLNIQKMCQNMPLMASFLPTIIEQAARSTRKLRVRISWDERGNAEKVLEIETFIVSVPEAEEANSAP